MIVVRAKRDFGPHHAGDRWRVTLREAARLERAGLATRLQFTPPRTTPRKVIEPVPLGGSWYLVGTRKVQGLQRALALATELS